MNERVVGRLYGLRVRRYVAALEERASLTALQTRRLRDITDLLDPDGLFLLADALRVGGFPPDQIAAQDAFQDFRKRLNQAAEDARVNLRLELSSHKTTPDRRQGWFCTGHLADDDLAPRSSDVDVDNVLRGYAQLFESQIDGIHRRLDDITEVLEKIAAGLVVPMSPAGEARTGD